MPQRLCKYPEASRRRGVAALGAALVTLISSIVTVNAQQLQPQAGTFQVHVGAAGVFFDASASPALAGMPIRGANIHASNNFTGSAEFEYYFLPELSASVSFGIPPETHIDGTGTLAPVGRLGDVHYALAAALVKFHLNSWGPFQPFAGAGIAYFKPLSANGVGIANLHVDDAVGPALQIGADWMVTPQVGLFASVSHAFLETKADGTYFGLPITANTVRLDPTVVQAGLTFRF